MEDGQPGQEAPAEVQQENWFGRHPAIIGLIAILVIVIAASGIMLFQGRQGEVQEGEEFQEGEIQEIRRPSNLSSEEILENLELIDVIYYKDGEEINVDQKKLSQTHLDCLTSYYNESTGYYRTSYIGEIRNKGDYLIDSVKVEVEFFDTEGNLVGTHFNYVNDLGPGEERRFKGYPTSLTSHFRTCATNIPSSTETPFIQNP